MCGKICDVKNYLINLAEDRARLDYQVGQFRRLGLDFERVEGFRDDRAEFSAFRWWCAVLRPVVKGEIGCALSHRQVYRRMSEHGEACAAVFEDDVVLSPRIAEALPMAEALCRRNPGAVVLLSDHRLGNSRAGLAGGETALSIAEAERDFCMEGYVIGRAAAEALARAQGKIRVPADSWKYFRGKGWVKLFRFEPALCCQANETFGSRIGEYYVVGDKSLPVRCWWKARRAVGVAIDWLLDGGGC